MVLALPVWHWQHGRPMGADLRWDTGLLELLKQTIQVCIDNICQSCRQACYRAEVGALFMRCWHCQPGSVIIGDTPTFLPPRLTPISHSPLSRVLLYHPPSLLPRLPSLPPPCIASRLQSVHHWRIPHSSSPPLDLHLLLHPLLSHCQPVNCLGSPSPDWSGRFRWHPGVCQP